MATLERDRVINRVIDNVLSGEANAQHENLVSDFFIVLDNGLVIQLLPYGLRLLERVPPHAHEEGAEDVKRCLKRKISGVLTDSNFYPPAFADADLRNPPYDDVYVILDRTLWIANRFFENGENALSVEEGDELYNLSDHYFDYWTRDEISLETVIS